MDFITTKETYIFLASFLVSLLTLSNIWQKRRIKGAKWLILAVIAITVDNFCAMVGGSTVNLEARIFWSKLQYLGAANSSVFLLLFFLNYPRSRLKQEFHIFTTLFFIPVLSIIMVMTNESHYLFWTGFELIPGRVNAYYFLHGPFFWILLIYSYACGLATIGLIIKNIINSSGFFRLQSIVMLISSFFPFLAGFLYMFGINPLTGLDLLPIGFSISSLGIVISIMFLRMFELVPTSRTLLFENLQDGVIVLDKKMQIVDINPAAKQMLGNNYLKLGDSIEKVREEFHNAINQTGKQIEVHLNNAKMQNLQFIPTPLKDENGNTVGKMVTIRDLTEIRNVEYALHQSEERYRSLINDVVNVSSIGMCILDENHHIVWINQAAGGYWNTNPEDLIGMDIRDLFSSNNPGRLENRSLILEKLQWALNNREFIQDLEIRILDDVNDTEQWLMYSSKPINNGYFSGGRIDQFIDITELKRLQEKIELLAITDELTGIYNRRGLFELGTHDFKRAHRTGNLLSAIYVDIDRFKDLNDRYGHAKGDRVLAILVKRIQSQLRDMDIFARYGGDEFVIMVPDANVTQILEIAQRIRSCIADTPFQVNGNEVFLESSIGIARIKPEDDFASLVDRADQYMYKAKQKGSNQVEIEKNT